MEPYQSLEQELAEWSGMEYVVACSSGTAALHLALEALQIPLGSKVIVPDYTMVACPRAVKMAGLDPVFVDCNERLLMDWGLLRGKELPTIWGAVMCVHIYGRRMDMKRVHSYGEAYAGTHPWLVVEDMAELHGVKPHQHTSAACWSFYKNKIIHGEEGGAVGFRKKEHADLARQLRSLGFTEAHDFSHVPRGHNYRMSNINAEFIRARLRREEDIVAARRLVEKMYDALCPTEWRGWERQSPWVYDFRIPELTRERQNDIVYWLLREGIAARHGFKPMTTQEEFRDGTWNPNAVKAGREVIYLPLTSFHSNAFEVVQRVLRCGS